MISKFATMRPQFRHANYFELDDCVSWGPRTLVDYEFILALRGEFLYEAEGRSTLQRSGEVLCIPPGVEHVYKLFRRARGRAGISCIHLDFESGLSRLKGDYELEIEPPEITRCDGDPRIRLLFKGLSELFPVRSPRQKELFECMARELFLRFASLWEGSGGTAPSKRGREMAACLTESLDEKAGRQKLAERFGLSPARVNRVFKEDFGTTPTAYLHAARVAKACSLLLDEGLSAKEAARELGFSDEAHFSKIFKRSMGFSPSELLQPRRKLKQDRSA